MANCTAKLRPFRPVNNVEISCDKIEDDHIEHEGILRDYAYSGSETIIKWFESDRRTYHNEWPGTCKSPGCILPLGHPRKHAE